MAVLEEQSGRYAHSSPSEAMNTPSMPISRAWTIQLGRSPLLQRAFLCLQALPLALQAGHIQAGSRLFIGQGWSVKLLLAQHVLQGVQIRLQSAQISLCCSSRCLAAAVILQAHRDSRICRIELCRCSRGRLQPTLCSFAVGLCGGHLLPTGSQLLLDLCQLRFQRHGGSRGGSAGAVTSPPSLRTIER